MGGHGLTGGHLERAYDILDRLTNDQLRKACKNPEQMHKRVDFNLTLDSLIQNEELAQTIRNAHMQRKEENEHRISIYELIKFQIKKELDENPDIEWSQVEEVLSRLPVEQLEQIKKQPTHAIRLVFEYRTGAEDNEVQSEGHASDHVTVEDVCTAIMQLQKLQAKDLHNLLEYTQLLLDYLTFPAQVQWRDDVVDRGQQEKENPEFYRNLTRMRQKLRAVDAHRRQDMPATTEPVKDFTEIADELFAEGDEEQHGSRPLSAPPEPFISVRDDVSSES